MKIKIQVTYQDIQERERRICELKDFATLLEIPLQKALHDPHYDIYVVQLPEDELHSDILQDAFVAFCAIKDHPCDLRNDSYPSCNL